MGIRVSQFIILFFNDEEPPQGMVQWDHPWTANPNAYTPPLSRHRVNHKMPKPEVKPKTFGFTSQLVQALTLTTEVSRQGGGGSVDQFIILSQLLVSMVSKPNVNRKPTTTNYIRPSPTTHKQQSTIAKHPYTIVNHWSVTIKHHLIHHHSCPGLLQTH